MSSQSDSVYFTATQELNDSSMKEGQTKPHEEKNDTTSTSPLGVEDFSSPNSSHHEPLSNDDEHDESRESLETLSRKRQRLMNTENDIVNTSVVPEDQVLMVEANEVVCLDGNDNDNNQGSKINSAETKEDLDFEIISPSRARAALKSQESYHKPYQSQNHNNEKDTLPNVKDEDDEDLDLIVTESNLTNATTDYVHARPTCGVYNFTKLPQPNDSKPLMDSNALPAATTINAKFCPKCYCYICDVPASDCTTWTITSNMGMSHCHAYPSLPFWDTLRQMKRRSNALKASTNNHGGGSSEQSPIDVDSTPPSTGHGQSRAPTSSTIRNPYSRPSLVRPAVTTGRNINVYNPYAKNTTPSTNSIEVARKRVLEPDSFDEYDKMDEQIERWIIENGLPLPGSKIDEEDNPRRARDMKITEILSQNLKRVLTLSEGTGSTTTAGPSTSNNATEVSSGTTNNSSTVSSTKTEVRIEGDVPSLNIVGGGLSSTRGFPMEGIHIGWPYPKVMTPQRQMILRILKGLKMKQHVILESPTGTGKSAAILCSVLAWQRWHRQQQQQKKKTQHSQSTIGSPTTVDDIKNLDQKKAMATTTSGSSSSKIINPFTPSKPPQSTPKGKGSNDFSVSKTQSSLDNVSSNNETTNVNQSVVVEKTPKIIYCSRTHSQVAQLVDSLRKTPYRPRMAILGSREHLCIHPLLKNRDNVDTTSSRTTRKKKQRSPVSSLPLNVECMARVSNTEKYRKSLYMRGYDDEQPPVDRPGDTFKTSTSTAASSTAPSLSQSADGEAIDGVSGETTGTSVVSNDAATLGRNGEVVEEDMDNPTIIDYTKKPTCSHYRQLTATRTATLAHASFLPNVHRVNTLSGDMSGSLTNMGTHDIEDLVSFGVNPHILRNVALYRPSGETTFGMKLTTNHNTDSSSGGQAVVSDVNPGCAADREGTVQVGDVIIKVNGNDVSRDSYKEVVRQIKSTPQGQPLLLDIVRGPDRRRSAYAKLNSSNNNDDDDIEDIVHVEGPEAQNESAYSAHSACPYYLSQALAVHADIVFCPYNYILDPGIRTSLNIDLSNTVVVLDEAHNIEDTLRESGSGSFTEYELYEVVEFLSGYANRIHGAEMLESLDGVPGADNNGKMSLSDVAHPLLVFVEQLCLYLKRCVVKFTENPGLKGSDAAIREWRKFKTPDDHVFEVEYYGPTNSYGQQAWRPHDHACNTTTDMFFKTLNIERLQLDQLMKLVTALDQKVKGGTGGGGGDDGGDNNPNGDGSDLSNNSPAYAHRIRTLMDRTTNLVLLCTKAMDHSNHYFVASGVKANGNLAFAAGDDDNEGEQQDGMSTTNRFRAKPKRVPLITSKAGDFTIRKAPVCQHSSCMPHRQSNISANERLMYHQRAIRHGEFCDGSIPPWEATLSFSLLSPGILMDDLSSQCRSLILASGTLSPIPSLIAELNLSSRQRNVIRYSSLTPTSSTTNSHSLNNNDLIPEQHICNHGLQTRPPPLEANHVIDLSKQLLALSIGRFPDGQELTVSYRHYSKDGWLRKLGEAVATVVEAVPYGGILIFLPSYNLLRRCSNEWQSTGDEDYRNRFFGRGRGRGRGQRGRGSQQYDMDDTVHTDAASSTTVWDRLMASKQHVMVEPTSGGQEEFEAAKMEYKEAVAKKGGCVLLAVYRGKMSEGISFNDNNARAVICIGLPLPNVKDRDIVAKRAYNDEQRAHHKRMDLLSGNDWYKQQAYRALAQALGRCIRHGADYGLVILMDQRHCDDGTSFRGDDGLVDAHRNLPKWMRHHVKNLSLTGGNGYMQFGNSSQINCGWNGLKHEFHRFFRQADKHCQEVIEDQKKARKVEHKVCCNGASSSATCTSTTKSKTSDAPSSSSTPLTGRTNPPTNGGTSSTKYFPMFNNFTQG